MVVQFGRQVAGYESVGRLGTGKETRMTTSEPDEMDQDSTEYEDQDSEPTTMAPPGEGPTDLGPISEAPKSDPSGPTDLP